MTVLQLIKIQQATISQQRTVIFELQKAKISFLEEQPVVEAGTRIWHSGTWTGWRNYAAK